jgi:16S rRNA G966 N2-methylase RsmD
MKNNCGWEKINNFYSLLEFKRFVRWLDEQIVDGGAVEIEAENLYSLNLEERWFKCLGNSEVWHLVYPDPPFAGLWEKVKLK